MSIESDAPVTPGPRPPSLRGMRVGATRWGYARGVPVSVWIAGVILVIVAILVIFGPLIAPNDPRAQNLSGGMLGPGSGDLLGTDALGRDLLSRVIVGARSAVVGALIIAICATTLGTIFGLLAGFKRGRTETVITRVVDVGIALPSTLVALVVAGVTGGGYSIAVLVLALLFAPYDIRFLRAATLEQSRLPYIESARTLGRGDVSIMARHILPNIRPALVTYVLLDFSYALVGLASLSFLGVGVPPGAADWGRMLSENLSLLPTNPVGALAPAFMLVITVVSLNLIGDWVQDRFVDSKSVRVS